jgi:dihydropteroate synthase
MHLQCGRFSLDLGSPVVMGVLNVTPDSFSDGGRFVAVDSAVAWAERMAADGAAIIDVGGESTRPGSAPVGEDEELRRVLPVVERLAATLAIPVSIDTRKPGVMRRAIAAGATIVNDVAALTAPGAIEAVAGSGVGVCLMHMQGEPLSMQQRPIYGDVLTEVARFLQERVAVLAQAGVQRERITLDPGIGFGKTVEHNLALLARQRELLSMGYPLLVGWSRKSSLGALTGRPVEQREAASIAAALAAAQRGAKILRVHDVAATVDALKVGEAAGLLPVGV